MSRNAHPERRLRRRLSFSRSKVVSRSQFSCRHPINLFNDGEGFISPQWWPKIFKWGFGFTNQFWDPSKEPNFSFDGNCVSLCGTFSRFLKRSLVVVRIQERDFVFQKRIVFLALNSYPTAYWRQGNTIRSLFSWPAFRCCDESCKQMKCERIHEALNMKFRKIFVGSFECTSARETSRSQLFLSVPTKTSLPKLCKCSQGEGSV